MLISSILSKLKDFFKLISPSSQHLDRLSHMIKLGIQHYNLTVEMTYSDCIFLLLSFQLHIFCLQLLNQLFLFFILLTYFTTSDTQLLVSISKFFKSHFLITRVIIRIATFRRCSDKFG